MQAAKARVALEDAVELLLKAYIPEDKEAVENTPFRHTGAIIEVLSGYEIEDPLGKHFEFVESDDLVIVKDIPFFSMCKHHILPFFGRANIGYLPDKKIIGISKIARVVERYSKRLQVQEQLGHEIRDDLQNSAIQPKGVIVVLEAQHLCMQMRGIESVGSITVTSSISGAFQENSDLKREFYNLIGR